MFFAFGVGVAISLQQTNLSFETDATERSQHLVKDFKPAKTFSSELITLAQNNRHE